MAKSEAYNMDCMEALKEYPDKYFDLAVVDPPYGISITARHRERERERETVLVGGTARPFGGMRRPRARETTDSPEGG